MRFFFKKDFSLPPALLWEYLTNPKYRSIIFGADSQRLEDLKQGRVADGSVYVCSHGKNILLQSIVDWHPFEQYTVKSSVPGGGFGLMTTRLTPQKNGTTVTLLSGTVQGGASILRGMINLATRKFFGPQVGEGLNALGELIDDEITQGKVTQQPAIQVPADQIEEALVESFAEI